MDELSMKIITDHNVDIDDGLFSIIGDVNEDLYEKVFQDIILLTKNEDNVDKNGKIKQATLFLSTYGGEVYYGFAIYDLLKISVKNLKIICSGPVMSAGTIILQAGHERVAMPNAQLLVHFGMEVNDSQQSKQHHADVNKRIKKILSDRCTVKEQTVKKWFSKESYFDSARAKEVGLVDRIVGQDEQE